MWVRAGVADTPTQQSFQLAAFFALESSLASLETDLMQAVAIIPSRIASTRLPRKPLREILGKPMIPRVYAAACACRGLSDVIVATDSDEIFSLCRSHGWNARMTSPECHSGTDRVREVAQSVKADIYVNVQGDEPLARPEHLDALLSVMKPGVEVGTVYTPCAAEDVNNPNAVKIVVALNGRALYFSRATIPFDRDGRGDVRYFKHLGFYAYTPRALEQFCQWPESELERSERLEQLRFLDHGVDIYAAETPFDTVGVDTEEDLRRVEEILRRDGRG
jgi:3-deoxy-manno-octulosonate cytidylyltransferase (CMP-KDO synthetase)